MARKTRVHELANELGVSSKDVLAKLKELGEFVRSPSSLIEPPVASRVRECYPNRPSRVPSQRRPDPVPQTIPLLERPGIQQRMNDPFDQLYIKPRDANQPRKRYKGEPGDLAKFLLDEYVVPRHAVNMRRPKDGYWQDEVDEANDLAVEWARCLFEGMTKNDILPWIPVTRPDDAIELHRAGIKPHELGWNYEDRERPTLGARLFTREWTIEQVILEVEARRQAS